MRRQWIAHRVADKLNAARIPASSPMESEMQKTQTLCLVTLTTIAVGFSLYYLQSVLMPFVIALFIVIGCRPIMAFFQTRLKFPRYVAFGVTFLIGVLALAVTGFVIWVSINDVTRNAGAYEQRLGAIATWVTNWMNQEREHQERLSAPRPAPSTAAPATPRGDVPGSESVETGDPPSGILPPPEQESAVTDPSQAIRELLDAFASQLQSVLLSLASSLSTLLSYSVLILIFVFFLLMGNDSIQQERPAIVQEIEDQIRKYLTLKTVISFFTGFAFGAVLYLFNVPLAVVFGFLAFLLNYIPNIGPLVANILPVPFLILNSEMSLPAAIICLILISAIQFVSGNVIETRLMGKSFDVSPVVLLISLMFFGLVWGIVGMFLATPIVSIARIVLQRNATGKPVAELIAGRWTGSPVAES